jgi:hypothetical protein
MRNRKSVMDVRDDKANLRLVTPGGRQDATSVVSNMSLIYLKCSNVCYNFKGYEIKKCPDCAVMHCPVLGEVPDRAVM